MVKQTCPSESATVTGEDKSKKSGKSKKAALKG